MNGQNSLIELFSKPNGEYDKRLQFEAAAIIVLVIWFFTYYFKTTYGFIIILLLFGLLVANSYVTTKKNDISDNNKATMIKLNKLQHYVNLYIKQKNILKEHKLDAMYVDSNLIIFLESISQLNEYNSRLYFLLLKGTNNILRIKRDIDNFYESSGNYPENTSELFEIAIEMKSKCMNDLHNFIYKLPKATRIYKYLTEVIHRYHILILRVLDSIHSSYIENNKQRGINSSTKYVSYSTVMPFQDADAFFP